MNRTGTPPQRSEPSLGVVLVDPLPVVRAGLGMLIEDRRDLEVVAEAGLAEEALEALATRHADVVVVGLGLGAPKDAYWLIRTVRERFPTLVVLACGARADAMTISRALFMGADGYVDKSVDPLEFLDALREAARGEMVLAGTPREFVGAIAHGLEHPDEVSTRLTEREREVLTVAAEGLTAREIATRLGVQERTVTTHLARIYGKLGVGTRVAALRVATRSGLVSVGSET
ncbi:MAG TPA: response regulator transcription factor [Actinomycetota bacterium]|nr:response regulator transcription factor [Actinomycetota bacterium]